jgi:hypothetical protein
LLFKAAWPIFAARTNSSDSTEGAVAQSVEQRTENPCVAGSIPAHTTEKPQDFLGLFYFILFNLKYEKSHLILNNTFLLFFGGCCPKVITH